MTAWNDATKYMRVAALAFYVYDWALTFPAEVRLYRRQDSLLRPSTACILLVLVRYLGLVALITNFFGFFAQLFTDATCKPYYHVMPVTQCVASWASHAVFVVRTIAICNNKRPAIFGLIALACVVSGLEIFAQLYAFFKFDSGSGGNCLLQYSDSHNVGWLYYLASSLFDFIIIILTYRGLSVAHTAKDEGPSGFRDVLWNSSIVYFFVTTFFNILNLTFYATYGNSNATILCAMGIAMTSMMSGRVILDLHNYADKRASSFHLSDIHSLGKTVSTTYQRNSFSTCPSSPTAVHAKSGFPTIVEETDGLPMFHPEDIYRSYPWDNRQKIERTSVIV